jgi:chromosome segregation ATPase
VRLGNSSPALGLPSIRKILNSPCEPFDILPFQEDLKAVNSLETFQKEATKAWEQSQQFYGWDREKMMTLMLASSWDLNLRLLTGMLRANNFLRTLQSMHRTSLGEIERLQQHSEEDQAEGFESKRKLSFTIEELKDMVKELRLQLALRDYAVANDKKEAESMEMRMWLDEEAFPMETRSHITKDQDPKDTDFMNRDSLELYDIKVNLEEPPTPQKRVLDWPAVMPPIKEKPWLDIEKRKSWEPDHDDTEELLQKIKALREELDHERFQKEHLEEALETMEGGEKEVDNAHTQAARRIAEKVGLAAALITTQRSLTDEKDRNVLLQKHVDAMEEEIATKDHKIKKLERELQETTAEMRQERRDATDAKFEAEDLRSKTQDLQIEISSLERQIGVLKVELATAEKDLLESLHQSQAWSDRQDDLERQIAELETQFYDTATDKGMLIQDVEMYQRQIAELDTQLYDAETEKGMLIQDVDMYQKQVAELETQFYDAETSKRMLIQDVEMYQQKYRDLVREFQDFREQHKTGTEDEEKEPPAVTEDVAATEDVDFHKMIETYETAIKDLRELLSTKEEQLSSHRAQNQKLADTLKSLRESTKKREEDQRDINKQRDETLAALRSKREYMLQRVRVLRTQGAAWRQELEGMAARRQHAEELYQQAHGALTTALEDLARMRAEEVVYGARERELEERVEMLYGELERRRRALQDMRLQILSGTEILKSHDRETDDVRGFLAALGADVKGMFACLVCSEHVIDVPQPLLI